MKKCDTASLKSLKELFPQIMTKNVAQCSILDNGILLLCVSDDLHNSLTRDVFNLQ